MSAVDLAYHVRLGEQMIRDRALIRTDDMTFSVAGEPWLDQQWGAQIVLAGVHRLGQWQALATLRAVLVALTLGLIFAACRGRGASARVASFLTVGAFLLAAPAMWMRPQLLAAPLFSATILALTVRHKEPRWLWAMPALTIAWANIHGSFPLSLLLISLALVADRRDQVAFRRLIAVAVLSTAATMLTPFGSGSWTYVLQLSTHPVVRVAVSEWKPMSLVGYPGFAFFLSVLVVGAALGRRGKPTSVEDLLALGFFFVVALPAVRGILWWGLAMPVVIAGWFTPTPLAEEQRSYANTGIIALLTVSATLALPAWRFTDEASQVEGLLREAPQGAVDAARAELTPGDRIVVNQPWASWFEYAAPGFPVFVDSRIELFPEDVWDEYFQLKAGGPRWTAILDRWEVEAVVLDRGGWRLDEAIQDDPRWTLAYEDDVAAVFVRS